MGRTLTEFDTRLGPRLFEAREKAKVTCARMSQIVGVSRAQLGKYEQGTNRTPAYIIQIYAHTLRVPVQDFFDPKPEDDENA